MRARRRRSPRCDRPGRQRPHGCFRPRSRPCRRGSRGRSVRVLLEAREPLGLVLLPERVDHVVDVAVHAPLEIREVVAKSLVGEAVLREVVRAHLLGPLAATDLRAACGARLELASLLLAREEARAQDGHRLCLVLELRPLVLAGHDLPGRDVRDPYRGVGRVHSLPALATRAVYVDLEIALWDLDVDLLGLRKHRDRRGRRMDAPLRLGRGHALHAVHARFELQLAVRALARDPEDDLFEAALLRVALRQDLDLPAVALGVAREHPVEIGREQGCLLPALASADLDDDVLLVQWIAPHKRAAHARRRLFELARRRGEVLARDVAQVAVVGVDELPRFLQALLGVAQRADRFDDGRQLRELLPHLADALVAAGDLRIGHEPRELVVTRLHLREAPTQSGGERIAHAWLAAAAVPVASASPASASCNEATATSIISGSGRRVVIPCSSSPGATNSFISGLVSCAAPKRSTSYEIEATGTMSARRARRSTKMFVRGRNANRAIETTTTNSRNAVPQRGCAVG